MKTMEHPITCKQAVDFLSKDEERLLTKGQQFALWRHLEDCPLCRRFADQNHLIIQAMQQAAQQTAGLPAAEKERMLKEVMQAGR